MQPSYVEKLRSQLRACIVERDSLGDAAPQSLLDAINDLECRIAWVDRACGDVSRLDWPRHLIGRLAFSS